MGHSNSGFIDNSLLVAESKSECIDNVSDTAQLMTAVGFLIHPEKSVLQPTQNIIFLGNYINSKDMTDTLPQDKMYLIVQECQKLSRKHMESIRTVARVTGLMVSSFSAVEYGPLHYRCIENEK